MAATCEELRARLARAETELHTAAMRWAGVPDEVPDLTLRQLQVLSLLRSSPGLTGQELAERVGVSTPTMSGILDRIAAKGLLQREPDPADRRRVLLRPTPEALALMLQLEEPSQRARSVLTRQLTRQELTDLCRLVERLRDIAVQIEDPVAR